MHLRVTQAPKGPGSAVLALCKGDVDRAPVKGR